MAHRYSKVAAFHEAGHAVARAHVGARITAAKINLDGTGVSFGTGELWRSASCGQGAAWDALIVTLAGAYAEARISKQSRVLICLTRAREDMEEGREAVRWLVRRGFAVSIEAAWERAERETLDFLRDSWSAIERVAAGLLERGSLEADEVRRLADIPMRSGDVPLKAIRVIDHADPKRRQAEIANGAEVIRGTPEEVRRAIGEADA